jgi:hypothetical protein
MKSLKYLSTSKEILKVWDPKIHTKTSKKYLNVDLFENFCVWVTKVVWEAIVTKPCDLRTYLGINVTGGLVLTKPCDT